ncbi:hexapeptide repeat-containing transferase [Gloeomargarita lithophora Alchichica-D10]|uniref:Hexapeptide repeat-containing transferase n=1 Tax=Gloeomargarita lithophora Alchichica-D10 TaxID=1188229 RepID=A0A1J0A8V8_9CYAN|nr:gamma carbonic anhydrase family protein [Gloeomargarita lithophora]APB32357.1 hexapeptide repeat-containing transferase [Gloeomargarita lithophora Alchichica-D10]
MSDFGEINCARPDIRCASFVAPNATLVGDVRLGLDANIWYQAVLRGDCSPIILGQGTNIQDGCILHGDPDAPTVLGDWVTVGHRAVIHSAQIESGTLIGIGAIVLNGVTVGTGCIVGAGALVTKSLPDYSLAVGLPAKVVREVTPQEAAGLITHAQHYVTLARQHSRQVLEGEGSPNTGLR